LYRDASGLGFKSDISAGKFLSVDIIKAGGMVYKYISDKMLLGLKNAGQMLNKSWGLEINISTETTLPGFRFAVGR
jgi:hypothetical protein